MLYVRLNHRADGSAAEPLTLSFEKVNGQYWPHATEFSTPATSALDLIWAGRQWSVLNTFRGSRWPSQPVFSLSRPGATGDFSHCGSDFALRQYIRDCLAEPSML
jgi:hypothetical protein